MYILGYSGLDGSGEFHNREFPNLSKLESRIFQGMDAAAAIIHDGEVIAAMQEERCDRIKQSNSFPISSINYCLKSAGITLDQVAFITHGFDYQPWKQLYYLDAVRRRQFDEVLAPERQISLLEKWCQPATNSCGRNEV